MLITNSWSNQLFLKERGRKIKIDKLREIWMEGKREGKRRKEGDENKKRIEKVKKERIKIGKVREGKERTNKWREAEREEKKR